MKRLIVGLAAAVVFLASSALGSIVNPDAETGNTTGWTLSPASGVVALTGVTDGNGWSTTPYEGNYFFSFLGLDQTSQISMKQSGSMAGITDPMLLFEGYTQTTNGDTGEAWLSIYDSDSNLLAANSTLLGSDELWSHFSVPLVVPVNADTWEVMVEGQLNVGGWINVHVDDLSLEGSQVIPEPSTLIIWSLLGGLGTGVGWWRRRKAA